jgi:hypothetical protein
VIRRKEKEIYVSWGMAAPAAAAALWRFAGISLEQEKLGTGDPEAGSSVITPSSMEETTVQWAKPLAKLRCGLLTQQQLTSFHSTDQHTLCGHSLGLSLPWSTTQALLCAAI